MSRKLASIEKITSLELIKDKDRIELATILGWHVIVGKGDFKVGDLVVYVEYDVLLPIKPEFEFLRSRTYSKKFNGFRIRNMKMAGVQSEGIVFPMDILPRWVPAGIIKSYTEGQDISEVLGVQKYDLEALQEVEKAKVSKNPIFKYMMRYKWFRRLNLSSKPKKGYPEGVTKSDETNIQVKFGSLRNKGYRYYTTEKLEGQAFCYTVIKNKFSVFSHNFNKGKRDNSNWWNAAIAFDIEKKMKNFMRIYAIKNMSIQGELVGPGIQKNIYKFSKITPYIFNATNLDDKKDFSFADLKLFCNYTNLNIVPILNENIKLCRTSDGILKEAEGKSKLLSTQEREGVVWRALDQNVKVSFKAKGKKYENWWSRKDLTQ